jgi:hypothetical protein
MKFRGCAHCSIFVIFRTTCQRANWQGDPLVVERRRIVLVPGPPGLTVMTNHETDSLHYFFSLVFLGACPG